MRFGMLLPHFGKDAQKQTLLTAGRELENLGFDSLWVRDHLLWSPHPMEGPDRTFIEPFITLAAIAGVTKKIMLGTAVLIPVRSALKLAQNLASLNWLAPGRVIAGVGLGSNQIELQAAGLSLDQREDAFIEQIQICRKVWSEDNVTWNGEIYRFTNATIYPKPKSMIPFWYGGGTRASVRRALEYCDGYLPGRMPIATLEDRLEFLRSQRSTPMNGFSIGYMALVCLDYGERGGKNCVDPIELASTWPGSRSWLPSQSGGFRSFADLEGMILTGSPQDIVRGVGKLGELGIDHLVFDLRFQFDHFLELSELIASQVIPHFK